MPAFYLVSVARRSFVTETCPERSEGSHCVGEDIGNAATLRFAATTCPNPDWREGEGSLGGSLTSIFKSDLERRVIDLCEHSLQSRGYGVVDIECNVGGKSLLRLYIERKNGGRHPVSVNDCVVVSHMLSSVLETERLFPGPYDLEVSSPGMERRLRLKEDFIGVLGKEVKLKLVPGEMPSRVTGTLSGVEDEILKLATSNGETKVKISRVKRAHLLIRKEDVCRQS